MSNGNLEAAFAEISHHNLDPFFLEPIVRQIQRLIDAQREAGALASTRLEHHEQQAREHRRCRRRETREGTRRSEGGREKGGLWSHEGLWPEEGRVVARPVAQAGSRAVARVNARIALRVL